MKLLKTLKIILYIFLGIYIFSLVMNPFMIYYVNDKNLSSLSFQRDLIITILYAVAGIIICFNGAQLLQNFEKDSISFKRISKSFKIIGISVIVCTLLYALIDYVFEKAIDTAFWIETFGNVVLIGFTGFFFVAISMIIKKADYYKTQNDLTI